MFLGTMTTRTGSGFPKLSAMMGNLTFALTLKTEVHPRQPRPAAMLTLPPDVPRNHLPGEVRTSCPAQ